MSLLGTFPSDLNFYWNDNICVKKGRMIARFLLPLSQYWHWYWDLYSFISLFFINCTFKHLEQKKYIKKRKSMCYFQQLPVTHNDFSPPLFLLLLWLLVVDLPSAKLRSYSASPSTLLPHSFHRRLRSLWKPNQLFSVVCVQCNTYAVVPRFDIQLALPVNRTVQKSSTVTLPGWHSHFEGSNHSP